MGTTAQVFYAENVNQTPGFGTTVKRWNTANPGTQTTSTTLTWTSTTASTETVIPFAATSTAQSVQNANGWAWDRNGTLGMDSTATAKRVMPAGTFNINGTIQHNAPALLATINANLSVYLYRITSANVASLITSNFQTFSWTLSAGTDTINANLTIASPVVLEADETFHVGMTITSAATSAVLGSVTNTVLTLQIGGATPLTATVPAPGFRTQYINSVSDSLTPVADTVTRIADFPRALSDSVTTSDSVARQFTGARSLDDTMPLATDTIARQFTGARSLDDTMPLATDTIARQFTGARSLDDTVTTSDSVARQFTGARSLDDTMPVNDTLTRAYLAVRDLTDTHTTVTDTLARHFTANRTLTESLTPMADAISRAFNGSRSMSDTMPLSDSIARSVIYSRHLLDELAVGGGNVVIINNYVRPTFIFDD